MKKRTGLTTENIFEKDKYRNIFHLINWSYSSNKKIKTAHLNYALVKNNNLTNNKVISKIKSFFNDGFGISEIDRLKNYDWLNDNTLFSTPQTLSNAIARMVKIGIITPVSDVKGYPYYIVTEKGIEAFNRYYINWYIFNYCPSEKLDELRIKVIEFI